MMEILRGCDVSHWDGGFDPFSVDVDFVVSKATQGKGYIDPTWQKVAHDTVESGRLLGLYHYLDSDGTPEEQADFFCSVVFTYVGEAMLFLDFEEPGMDVDDAKRFMDRVYTKTGVHPVAYMSKSMTYGYDWADVCDDYDLWVAWYPPVKSPSYEWAMKQGSVDFYGWPYLTMWQFCSDGRLEGHDGDLDLDLFYGDKHAWRKYASRFGSYAAPEEEAYALATVYEDDHIVVNVKKKLAKK